MRPTMPATFTDAPAPSPAVRVDGAPGYLTSSFELRAGLEVTALAFSQLPVEVLRELQRLRSCWDPSPQVA